MVNPVPEDSSSTFLPSSGGKTGGTPGPGKQAQRPGTLGDSGLRVAETSFDSNPAKEVNPWLVLATAAVGTYMATLDGSIVNVALPVLSGNFGADPRLLQWVVSAYLLTVSSTLPSFGRLADMIGRKTVFILGLLIFTGGSLLCAMSASIQQLILFRALQALGGSMFLANTMAIVANVFPPQQRGSALGTMGSVVAIGSLSGPAIGGMLLHLFSWRSIFFVNLPVGLLGTLAAWLVMPPLRREGARGERFDFVGALTFAGGLALILLAISSGEDWGWRSPLILAGVGLGAAMLLLFVWVESRTPYPIINLSFFKVWSFSVGNLTGFFSYVLAFFSAFLVPLYLGTILHYEAARIGLLMTFQPMVMFLVAPLSGWLSDRIGSILPASVGLLVLSAAHLLMARLTPASNFMEVAGRLILIGTGMGLFTSPNNSAIMGSLPPAASGVASGIIATVRNVGMVTGVATAVAIFTNQKTRAMTALLARPEVSAAEREVMTFMAGFSAVFKVGMAIGLLGVLLSLLRAGRPKKGFTGNEKTADQLRLE
ncbi:MAG: DHA2 family efflux MFS transporter permease subunit [Firmicutes bacterium]|nr:DHA2 family efflux MFS transporter permease subunit [Bacillota bacterium]MCL5040562.1 DHA2 family efflux MFS transporter permease subunit [Bacillota bacterium]